VLKIGIGYKFVDFIIMASRGFACILLALFTLWDFSAIFLLIVPIFVASSVLMVSTVKNYTIKGLAAYGLAGKIAHEMLSSIRTVVSFGLERKAVCWYEEKLKVAEKTELRKNILVGIYSGISEVFHRFLFGVGIYYAIYLSTIDCSKYTPKLLIQCFFCMVSANFALASALTFLKDLSEAKGAAKKLFNLIETKSLIDIFENEKTSNKDHIDLSNIKGSIKFEEVCFSYPQRPHVRVLNRFSMNVEAGKTIAICGSR
jgi:ABC-type multidrug transport system fused ATPase/permease subunit